jgi:signal transduction histidine kinase
MQERLHQIGGRLNIDSAVGHTTLTAVIPIDERLG